MVVDELNKSENIILEINGDFWHANPDIYEKNDIVPLPGGGKTAGKIWSRDIKRRKVLEGMGYEVIWLWEKTFKQNKDKILEKIKQKLSRE